MMRRAMLAVCALLACSAAAAAPLRAEDGATGCAPVPLPAVDALPAAAALPDPFAAGDGKALTRKADWPCRRSEVSRQLQAYELGEKPAPVAGSVTSSSEGASLTVTVQDAGRSINFVATVQLPTSGAPPYPAVIGIGRSSLNNAELLQRGVAIINFPNDDVAQQLNGSSRNLGKFFTLYPQHEGAGALVAWAWGVSRLIDAIEQGGLPAVDARRLGVTGCSRNGKGALMAGALDERLALTIVQESGSGGAAAWRVSDAQKAAGQNVQTLSQIVQENVWFRSSFSQFGARATRLPYDHHQVLGLVAPRGLLVIENTSMEWLGNQSAWTAALAARETYAALGTPDAMGLSQVGGHNHCQLPASQEVEVNAFVDRFLKGQSGVDTNVVHTDGGFTVDRSRWMPWKTPALK
ncbi:MAG: dockerin-like protein [Rubrivivax sp.]|nr:MAG: dockerin-like protein [Rubrivivax sp.]